MNPEVWQARNSRLADLNGDGLVDLAMAFHACWSDADAAGRVEPDESSAFSRVFYGTGGGRFIDSGLSAGRPFDANLYDHATWPRSETRLPGRWAGAERFGAQDLDRSGHPSLIQWGWCPWTPAAPRPRSSGPPGAWASGAPSGSMCRAA